MRILIVKLHALGDLVIATPAIRHIREEFPEAEIDLLTAKWSEAAVIGNGNIDNLIVAEDRLFFDPSVDTVIPVSRLLFSLRSRKYDMSVSFHSSRAIRAFVALIGAKRRFCFGSGQDDFSVLLDETRHSALTAWELAEKSVRFFNDRKRLTPLLNELSYDWSIAADERKRAKELIKSANLSGKGIAIILPGGGLNPADESFVRRWRSDYFSKLIDQIHLRFGFDIVLAGAKSDADVCSEVENGADAKCLNLAGKTDIRLIAALMGESELVVSNDSGPLHIAAAVGVPVVGIFGPTGWRLKMPPGEKCMAAYTGIPCSPCFFTRFKSCIFDDIRCMNDLTPERVMATVEELLNKQFDKEYSVQ